ncbi:MAG: PilT/PilU family type 4a pilus ATPase [Bryobacterales bacterium]|nr:PilT/PilU family type 4a pilus ATPase [Bryobacterales bacterium]
MSQYGEELEAIVAELNRSAPGGRVAAARTTSLDALLQLAARNHATDVLLVAGSGVAMRIQGELTPSTGPVLDGEAVKNLVSGLLDGQQQERLRKERSLDLAFARESVGRIRCNIHFQRGTMAAALRILPPGVPTIESLHLPVSLGRLAEARQGLVLVTGASGCGKSSTLAALIGRINAQRRCHIVTIEDPIEYHHNNQRSIVEQMEIGLDATDFAAALRSILRQNPDVILVGEMRDAETMAAALSAAETGHLVMSTLHTNDAVQAVARILDSFGVGQQQQIRQQISLALTAVVSQQLVPSVTGLGRYPAVEAMMGTAAVRNLIRKGEEHQLLTQMSIGRGEGMMTMEQSLAELVRGGRITRDTARAHCFRPRDLERYLES